ncbi:MAG: hypothetical protein ABIG71_03885 [Candidatus Uhrbacteria bacterium]
MKRILLIVGLVILLGAGCSSIGYGLRVFTDENQTYSFPDGLTVRLVNITDSRCSRGLECIWEGQIGGNFELANGAFAEMEPQDLYLGELTAAEKTVGPYTFFLQSVKQGELQVNIE